MPRAIRCFWLLLVIAGFASIPFLLPVDKINTAIPFVLSDAFAALLLMALLNIVLLMIVVREFLPGRQVPQFAHGQGIRVRATLFSRVGFGLVGTLFLLAGLWIQFNDDTRRTDNGMSACIIGAVWIVASIVKYKGLDRRLALSNQGLDYSAFKTGPIAWDEISSVSLSSWRPWAVRIDLRDKDKYMNRLVDPWRQGDLRIEAWQFGFPPEQLMAAIQMYRPTQPRPIDKSVLNSSTPI